MIPELENKHCAEDDPSEDDLCARVSQKRVLRGSEEWLGLGTHVEDQEASRARAGAPSSPAVESGNIDASSDENTEREDNDGNAQVEEPLGKDRWTGSHETLDGHYGL